MRVAEHDATGPLLAEWGELVDRTGASPFLHPGWLRPWSDAFGSGELRVLAARRGGELAGVLAFHRRRGALVSPTNWHTPEFGVACAGEEAAQALFEAALARDARRLDLAFLHGEGIEARLLRRLAAARRPHERVVARSPYVAVEEGWDAYWQRLSRQLRSGLRRRRRRLEEDGEVSLEVADGSERLGQLLEQGFRLEASGWKGERGTAIVSRPETHRFYREVARWAAGRGVLRLPFLRLDGEPIAFHFAVEAHGRYYLLKPGHDARRERRGPGTLLLWKTIERAFATGLRSYEFLGGADDYKLRWTQTCREMVRIQTFSRSPAGFADRLAQTHGRRLAKRLLRRG